VAARGTDAFGMFRFSTVSTGRYHRVFRGKVVRSSPSALNRAAEKSASGQKRKWQHTLPHVRSSPKADIEGRRPRMSTSGHKRTLRIAEK
jgi:hypothetical protein